MARSHAKTLVWYATFTKILPLLLSIGVFFTSSSWVRNFLPEFINEVSLFYGITFFYAGLIFVAVEAPFALPEAGKSNAGKFGAVLLVGLGIGSFIFAGLTFFGVYNPTQDDGTLNTVLSILLLIMMSMFVFQAREEIFHHRRLNISAKLKGIMG